MDGDVIDVALESFAMLGMILTWEYRVLSGCVWSANGRSAAISWPKRKKFISLPAVLRDVDTPATA
ncbi:hypothetical protein IG631_04580 [Alternaria alternata]|nr:hypothetical protein IG631_04580 [Alternaria alternata]